MTIVHDYGTVKTFHSKIHSRTLEIILNIMNSNSENTMKIMIFLKTE